MPRGGKREGAGRPKGTTKPDTRKMLQVRVTPETLTWIKIETERLGINSGQLIDLIIKERKQ